MSILFIALQCYQCSTMQVKQQKKSSNKWSCVICHEKQSTRKIFAQSYQAKDVRKFVQGVNSSRSIRSDGSGWISPPKLEKSDGCDFGCGSKKRMDWSEYLNGEDEKEEKEISDEDNGVVVTAEFPMEKFACRPVTRSKMSKLNIPKKRISDTQQGSIESLKCQQATIQNAPSKWSNYLENEEEIALKFDDDNESGVLNVNESLIVDDEVHSDFI